MNTDIHQIVVSGVPVHVVRKEIKNLHLGVYPPHGRVRVAVPNRISDEAVRLAVVDKLGWIKRQKARFEAQPRQSKREMVGGESHYYLGRRYRLRLVDREGLGRVVIRNNSIMELHIRPNSSPEQRERVLQGWYRTKLKTLIPPLMSKWEQILNVKATECRVRAMKTRWGSCNARDRRIWLNLELAKKPVRCLEFIIAHELAHMIERHHNERFLAIMDQHMALWRKYRDELNSAPLAHANWGY